MLWMVYCIKMLLFAPYMRDVMANCCICKDNPGTIRIKDGNPDYRGKPVCKVCQRYRRLLMETR